MRTEIWIYKNKVKEKTAHYSQKDYSTGFGGKFGVMKDRQGELNKNLQTWISNKLI